MATLFRWSFPRTRRLLFGFAGAVGWGSVLLYVSDNMYWIANVNGQSMYPFINPDYNRSTAKDRVLVDMWRPARGLHRGDIVTFWAPHNPERMGVKRVIALAGDEVTTRAPYPFPREVVPPGHVWVEGDNPEGSRFSVDSNTFGPLAASLITGKVKAGIWPKLAWIRWQDWKDSPRVRKNAVMHEVKTYSTPARRG